MKTKGQNIIQNSLELRSDISPLIAFFELLLEWDMEDVQEKAEQRKEVS